MLGADPAWALGGEVGVWVASGAPLLSPPPSGALHLAPQRPSRAAHHDSTLGGSTGGCWGRSSAPCRRAGVFYPAGCKLSLRGRYGMGKPRGPRTRFQTSRRRSLLSPSLLGPSTPSGSWPFASLEPVGVYPPPPRFDNLDSPVWPWGSGCAPPVSSRKV